MQIFTPNTVISSTDVNANFSEVADITNWSNPYKFSVYREAAFTASGNIVFDTELFDTNSNFDTSTGKYTIPLTGYYQFNARTSTTGNIRIFISLFKNSVVAVARGLDSQSEAISSSNLSYMGSFTAGDTVYISTYGSGNGEHEGQITTYLNGYLVSTT
jgi:hypothetical protein